MNEIKPIKATKLEYYTTIQHENFHKVLERIAPNKHVPYTASDGVTMFIRDNKSCPVGFEEDYLKVR